MVNKKIVIEKISRNDLQGTIDLSIKENGDLDMGLYDRGSTVQKAFNDDEYVKNLISNIRQIPDFVMTSKNESGVYLIEVKYQRQLNLDKVREFSEKIHSKWDYSWLFLATQEKFYFDSCYHIITTGTIDELNLEKWIELPLQNKYLNLLRKYIPTK